MFIIGIFILFFNLMIVDEEFLLYNKNKLYINYILLIISLLTLILIILKSIALFISWYIH